MADWLKVEKITPDKPEIAILSRALSLSLGDAFLAWFRVYRWADGITDDGRVPFLSLDEGDRLSGACPGTCAALASKDIGWLETKTMRGTPIIVFKKWDRHNGDSAKRRALSAEKKRKQRKKVSPICPPEIGTKTGPQDNTRQNKRNKKGGRPQDSETFVEDSIAALEAKRVGSTPSANGTQGTG